jgi:two-component system chemotaxis response regulator CheB
MEKIKVFIIDDSAIVRQILTDSLSRHPGIEVVGSAPDPFIARDKLETLDVDVITLDIEMPRMDGLTFLKYLMKYRPIPVIVVSSLTDNANRASMEAMEMGAADIVPKPGGPFSVDEVVETLIEKIRIVHCIDPDKLSKYSEQPEPEKCRKSGRNILSTISGTNKLIAVGASTGGTQALEILFGTFGIHFPPTLAVIHMPAKFTDTFAKRLNEICPVTVKEAVHDELILPGTVYLAPGNYHLTLKSVGTENRIRIVMGPKFYNQRPAVEVLFDSVAENIGRNSLGVLLTGMGKDGAQGLLNIKKSGGITVAQDEKTSIVYGMPKEAADIGAADYILPLDKITDFIREKLKL